MKTKIAIFILLFSVFTTSIYSQKKKKKPIECIITYSITPIGEIEPTIKANLPTEVKLYIKGQKSLIEMNTPAGKQSVISDNEKLEQVILIDMLGQKLAITSTKEENEKAISNIKPIDFTPTDESKKISGYLAYKYIIKDENNNTFDFYVSKEFNIPNLYWNTPYRNIDGILLEYYQKNNEHDFIIKYTVKEIKFTKIKDQLFEIPNNFVKMSLDEFKKAFGGE